MRYHTARAMDEISKAIQTAQNDRDCFYKVNWIIVSTSHDIYKTHGGRGHSGRQSIRRHLWNLTTKRHPCMRKYRIPSEIRGDSKCKIKLSYTIISAIRSFFGLGRGRP
jgi:hypothetical protein